MKRKIKIITFIVFLITVIILYSINFNPSKNTKNIPNYEKRK